MAEQVIKKAPLRLLESVLKPKLIIPIEVSKKKDYLCTIIPDVEWSGILFYKVEGDLDKVESLVFTAVDIHPMDKGTGTATTYKFDSSEVVDIFADKPELMDCRFGHIHSHNKMGVFFSGTDNDELRDNAPNHNIYLSLIVNNAGDLTAKVAILSKLVIESKQTISFKGILGKLFNMEIPENKEEEVILTFTMDIEEVKTPLIEDTIFMDKVKEIMTPKKYVPTIPATAGYKPSFPSTSEVYKPKSQKNNFDEGFVSDSDAIDFIHSTIGFDTISNKPLLYILRENLVSLDMEVKGSQLDAADYVETMFMGDMAEVFDPFCDGYWSDTVGDNAKIRRIILKAVSILRPMSSISIVNSLINMYTKMGNNDFVEVKRWKRKGAYNGR